MTVEPEERGRGKLLEDARQQLGGIALMHLDLRCGREARARLRGEFGGKFNRVDFGGNAAGDGGGISQKGARLDEGPQAEQPGKLTQKRRLQRTGDLTRCNVSTRGAGVRGADGQGEAVEFTGRARLRVAAGNDSTAGIVVISLVKQQTLALSQ